MGDIAAAAPIQPLAQGIVTFPGGPPNIAFEGHGIVQQGGAAPVYVGMGHYVLFLDPGLPGLAGAIEPLPVFPLVLPIDPNVRTNIMPLGSGVPPLSGIYGIGFAWVASAVAGVGSIAIAIVLTNEALAMEDPDVGFQITIWKGLGGGPVL
jgi:hypothetical protein